MIRKQFHITKRQNDYLNKVKRETGMKQAETVRRAIDRYIKGEKDD